MMFAVELHEADRTPAPFHRSARGLRAQRKGHATGIVAPQVAVEDFKHGVNFSRSAAVKTPAVAIKETSLFFMLWRLGK